MSPLGGPDGQYGTGQPQPNKRQPWEWLFDILMLSGAGILVWNTLVVAGVVAGPTLLIHPAWGTTPPRFDDLLFIGAMALVAVAEYPALLVILNQKAPGSSDARLLPSSIRIKIEAFFTAMTWLYLVMLWLVTPKGI